MTTQTKSPRPKTDRTLGQLDPELLERIEKARGETPPADWIAEAIEERLEQEGVQEPVADLDEEPKRATIRFRKKLYELRNIAEFGPLEQHNLNLDGQEFATIWQSEEQLSAESTGGQRLLMLTDSLFDRVIDAPDDVRGQFTAGQKAQVILSFTVAPARQLAQLMALIQQVAQPGNSESATTS